MSLSIACSSCGAKLRAPDNAAGQSFKCPKCGNVLRAPTTNGLPDYDLSKESEEREPEEQESLRSNMAFLRGTALELIYELHSLD